MASGGSHLDRSNNCKPCFVFFSMPGLSFSHLVKEVRLVRIGLKFTHVLLLLSKFILQDFLFYLEWTVFHLWCFECGDPGAKQFPSLIYLSLL